MKHFKLHLSIICLTLITACGGKAMQKPVTKAPASTQESKPSSEAGKGRGGYYLDDGPSDNAPADIDSIPDAQPRTEAPLPRVNKPYMALGQKYTPMTAYAPYTKRGVASWYGKRYHGKKTSSGEVYDMYAMTGAHTTLPIPSYVRVTNPVNGRSVLVRINDRGPFKHDRLIDLSYAAAYKLRLIDQGSGVVEVEAIDTSAEGLSTVAQTNTTAQPAPVSTTPVLATPVAPAEPVTVVPQNNVEAIASYYVQVGAFRSEQNGQLLQKKILGLDIAGNAAVTNVYNGDLYRVRIGPFESRQEADASANKLRKQLNMSAIVTNQ